jgi:hypothetical protein
MNALGSIPFRIRAALDRDLMVWAVGPALGAILVTTLFVIPNYTRALRMQDEAQQLEAVSSENISQRNNLKLLEQNVSSLREECNRRCRPLAEGTDRDHLPSAITRPTDGAVVREQSIRISVLARFDGIAADGPVMRREVTVEMTGTFDCVFGVVDAAEAVDQLITPRSIEIVVMSSPAEQATLGNPAVRATMIFEEWFDHQAKPAQEARP